MKKPIIEFTKVNIFYHRHEEILRGVNFTIDSGEAVVILGPNGSGKTSLIRTFHGIAKYNGQIFLHNQNIKNYSRKAIAQEIAYISQIENNFEGVTVIDYLKMARMPYYNIFNTRAKEDTEIIIKYLKQFNLLKLQNKYMEDLSGGQRQIISILCGVVQDASILLVDEPTNHLDPKIVLQVFKMLHDLKKQGKTIILISHSLDLATELADAIILIKNGKLLKKGPKEEILNSKNIDHLFDIKSQIHENGIKMALK